MEASGQPHAPAAAAAAATATTTAAATTTTTTTTTTKHWEVYLLLVPLLQAVSLTCISYYTPEYKHYS
jgi:hypothetical protein